MTHLTSQYAGSIDVYSRCPVTFAHMSCLSRLCVGAIAIPGRQLPSD